MHQLEGYRRTAIVASGRLNACAVLRLMDDYAQGPTGRRSYLKILVLEDERTFRQAKLARNTDLWHCCVKTLMIAALDISNKKRAACQEDCATSNYINHSNTLSARTSTISTSISDLSHAPAHFILSTSLRTASKR